MKRAFIYLSTLVVAFFLLISIKKNYDYIAFSGYKAVDIIGTNINGETIANRETFTTTLDQLVQSTNSVIARKVIVPENNGEANYTYVIYGNGQLPEEMNPASEEAAEASDLVTSYLILSGNLDQQTLMATFQSLGYRAVSFESYSVFRQLLAITFNEYSLISVLLFLLTFVGLTLIYRIKALRTAGLRFISGQSKGQIMLQSVLADGVTIGIAYIISVSIAIIGEYVLGIGGHLTFQILLLGVTIYSVGLAVVSLVLSVIYLLGLRVDRLVEVLKGKLPFKQLLAVMLLGQLLAILIVGWVMGRFVEDSQLWTTISSGANVWDQNTNAFQIRYSLNLDSSDEENQKWFDYTDEAVRQQHGIHVYTPALDNMEPGTDENIGVSEYGAYGNAIYVSPSYLDAQHVDVDQAFKDKMANLSQGEFGLILPESLKDQQDRYEAEVAERMSEFAHETVFIDSPKLFDVTAYVTTVATGQRRFLYNTMSSYYNLQFLEDPIIVVTTPTALGNTPNGRLYYSTNAASGLQTLGYEETIALLKKHDLYRSVYYVLNSRMSYYKTLNEQRNQLIFLGIGMGLGLLTSILLFDTMNLLYFEQFRRDIFIKRLSGLAFGEIHLNYLLMQGIVLVLGTGLLIIVTHNVWISLLTLVLFLINALIILHRQSLSEAKTAITVLKGK